MKFDDEPTRAGGYVHEYWAVLFNSLSKSGWILVVEDYYHCNGSFIPPLPFRFSVIGHAEHSHVEIIVVVLSTSFPSLFPRNTL
jgi:hypothetical protein